MKSAWYIRSVQEKRCADFVNSQMTNLTLLDWSQDDPPSRDEGVNHVEVFISFSMLLKYAYVAGFWSNCLMKDKPWWGSTTLG